MYEITQVTGSLAGLGLWAGKGRVTEDEIAEALESRNYKEYKPIVHHEPVRHVPPVVTRAQAISIACDEMVSNYKLPHTTTHPYVFTHKPDWCYVRPEIWEILLGTGAELANYYMRGGKLPDWVVGISQGVSIHGFYG